VSQVSSVGPRVVPSKPKTPLLYPYCSVYSRTHIVKHVRVKLDAHGCSDYTKKLEQAESVTKLFDCEDRYDGKLYLEALLARASARQFR